MTVREYLKRFANEGSITFIKQITVKDEHTPFYHSEYQTSPINSAREWSQYEKVCDCLVINADHPPIDVTGMWGNWYKKGHLLCAMITTEAELIKLYGEEQGRRMVDHYKRTVL